MKRLLQAVPVVLLAACGEDASLPRAEHAVSRAPLVVEQGGQFQGGQFQGGHMQGGQPQGDGTYGAAAPREEPLAHLYAGMSLAGARLENVRIERGELVAERDGRTSGRETLRGAQLAGAELQAMTTSGASLRHRIAGVTPEGSAGDTFLYRVEQQAGDGTWSAWCKPDVAGISAAIPVAAVFDGRGNRVESRTHFTFGCTGGAIGKCTRWGYRPWATRDLHWACTRMARADYCGDGTPNTREGTAINIWDTLSPAIQAHGPMKAGMHFEAGWSTHGAVCVGKQRWGTEPMVLGYRCPDRFIPPGFGFGTLVLCEDFFDGLPFGSVQLFNESEVNVE